MPPRDSFAHEFRNRTGGHLPCGCILVLPPKHTVWSPELEEVVQQGADVVAQMAELEEALEYFHADLFFKT